MLAHSLAGALPEGDRHEASAGAMGEDFVEGRGARCVGQGDRQIWCELLNGTEYKCLIMSLLLLSTLQPGLTRYLKASHHLRQHSLADGLSGPPELIWVSVCGFWSAGTGGCSHSLPSTISGTLAQLPGKASLVLWRTSSVAGGNSLVTHCGSHGGSLVPEFPPGTTRPPTSGQISVLSNRLPLSQTLLSP